jgi:hypothetical protein
MAGFRAVYEFVSLGPAAWARYSIALLYKDYLFEMFYEHEWSTWYAQAIERVDAHGILWMGLPLFHFTNGLIMLVCARGVKHGSRKYSVAAKWALMGTTSEILLFSVIISGLALAYGLGLGGPAHPSGFWGLLNLLILVPVILILFDLLRFLKWIALNPLEEKPAMAFLPTRGAGS